MKAIDPLFSNVPEKDYLSFFKRNRKDPDCRKVVDFLDLKNHEVSKVTRTPPSMVRYDRRVPPDLRDRIREWAILVNLVAGFFKGDAAKTFHWFTLPNPLLGNATPRDMIRFGRFQTLCRFVAESLSADRA